MKQKNILLAFFLTAVFYSCRKEGIPNLILPAVTQTGQNTLGFIIDSKICATYGKRCTTLGGCKDNKVSAIQYTQSNGDVYLEISAGYNADTVDQAFYISTTNITNTGTFPIDSSLNQGMTFYANQSAQFFQNYRTRKPGKCFLTITRFDTTNKIISGVFNATLYNIFNINDSVKIESGRFDAELNLR